MDMQLILASGSPYRRQLLERLGRPFATASPDIDETPLPGEAPEALAGRLAAAKAQRVADAHRGEAALVIGSDQVASLHGAPLGKPRDHAAAVAQLQAQSGQSLTFFTGLSLINCKTASQQTLVEPFEVRLRKLTREQIEAYLAREPALDAAGSFHSEGLGIVLFESFAGRDPNSLIGLPLMALTDLLRAQGMDPLGAAG